MENVQEPPKENAINQFDKMFIRRLKELHNLPDDEEIIYMWKGPLEKVLSDIKGKYFFTNSSIIVPKWNAMGCVTGYKKILWEKFADTTIEEFSSLTVFGLKFDGDKVFAIFGTNITKWRYFYQDLQKYLEDNTHRVKSK